MTRRNPNDAAPAGRETNTRRKRTKILLGGLFVMALCGAVRYYWGAPPASADPTGRRDVASRPARPSSNDAVPQAARAADSENSDEPSIPAVVATVNTQRITREDLAKQCLRHFGKEVLGSMVNKRLIALECRQRGLKVTRAEVNAEIEVMARRFKIPVDQWLKLLQKERNITPDQYASDIIWPTIALRKLAGNRLDVSPQELQTEYDIQYGEQIRVRLIAASSLEKANTLRAKVMANPEDFGNLAKKYSEDGPSASVKGVINPIRKHGSYQEIEDAVFNMRDGQISPVIKAGNQYLVLKREGAIEAQRVDFDEAAPKLEAFLRDKKMRTIAQKVFAQLQDRADKEKAIRNVWNDPAMRQKMPGVAALVYDDEISMRELGDACIARHGQEVLEGTISHKILEIECKQRSITISEKELDQEIARAALMGAKAKKDGSPDVDAWLALVNKRGVSLDVYRNDLIWTSVALKKLVGNKVEITDEDLQKGYEANFGPRVRCKAIVLNDMRRAQQVFEMARKNNTSEAFGKLASHYSVEPGSQALEGDVPPIRRHGGQPTLEKEAFELKQGELSGVIQAGDKFIILRCEGRTEPVGVKFEEVRDEIRRDLQEKKLQMAMQERFESLQEKAVVDNYLAGTSHTPKPSRAAASAHLPTLKQLPSR